MDLQAMREERAQIWARMQEIMARSAEANEINAEDRAAYDAAELRLSELTADIDRTERHERQSDELNRLPVPPIEPRGPGVDPEETYRASFDTFVRRGMSNLDGEQRTILRERFEARAQGAGVNTAGGYLVPPGYWQRITEVMKAFGGLLYLANILDTDTGNPIQWPNNDDTANVGAILGENTQVTELDLTVGSRTLGAYIYTTNLILASNSLLQDSAFDLDTWIPRKLGIRWGRAIANHLVNGTGAGQPTGLIPTIRTGKAGLTGQTVSVIYDDLVDLQHSVDPAYRQLGNCRYLLNDLSLGVIRKLKDNYGHPLWQPSLIPGAPDMLLGYPIVVDQAMPVMAASAKSIAFGDFQAGYVVRRVNGQRLMRLEERYADYDQVGFVGFTRLDARPDDVQAVAAYVNSAT